MAPSLDASDSSPLPRVMAADWIRFGGTNEQPGSGGRRAPLSTANEQRTSAIARPESKHQYIRSASPPQQLPSRDRAPDPLARGGQAVASIAHPDLNR